MDLPRAFNGELVFANDLQVREGFGDEISWAQEIFRGGRFHVSADGTILPNWIQGLPHIQCQIDLQDVMTLDALWDDMKGKGDINIPVHFSFPLDFRSCQTVVSKGIKHFFFHELRYASVNS